MAADAADAGPAGTAAGPAGGGGMRRIWPEDRRGPLDDRALERLYAFPDSPADRAWLAVNFVSSVDGAVEIDGHSRQLSNAPDRVVYRLGSDLADVVLLGAGTAVGEGFTGIHPDALGADRRRRHGLAPIPPIAVVTTGPGLPPDAPVLTEAAVPTLVITHAGVDATRRAAWTAAGAEVLTAGRDAVDLPAAIAALHARGLRRIDCEGGPRLFGALLAAGLVDELRLTLSPLLVAGAAGRIAAGAGMDPAALRLSSAVADGDTLLLRYLLTP